ncbi:Arb2 domain-containing protein [Xylariomycetidae sp. FL0641]|nr:Arb2 domain-containing protein [Xylariomycetidae sp. FL0641]
MFRRLWSGLPADPEFPSDLKELGYFINEKDEVRSIANPKAYLKYFINRNPRWNERQRFGFNKAIQEEIHKRLSALGLQKINLPLGITDLSQPHVPIFVSEGIECAGRVVVVFGESMQDLGVLAQRVAGGPGGIDKGSLVTVVRELQKQASGPDNDAPPGIILANLGELSWWDAGKRTLSYSQFDAAPMPSAAHRGNNPDRIARVPGNGNRTEHVKYIFEQVVPHFVNPSAGLDLVVLGDAADVVQKYLDWAPTWARWSSRINCLATVGGTYPIWQMQCEGFKAFLRDRARAYTTCTEPLGMVLSGPDGNPNTVIFTQLGCPVFSGGEACYIECLLIRAWPIVLPWLEEVAHAGPTYANPTYEVAYSDQSPENARAEPDWGQWEEKEGDKKKEVNGDAENKEGEEQKKKDANPYVVRVDSLSDSGDDKEEAE